MVDQAVLYHAHHEPKPDKHDNPTATIIMIMLREVNISNNVNFPSFMPIRALPADHCMHMTTITYVHTVQYIDYMYTATVMTFCINRTLCVCLGKSQEAWHQQMTAKLVNEVSSAKSTQYIHLERHKEPYNITIWTH